MPRRTPTKFRPLAAADEAPQPRRVDHALDLDAAAAVAQALRAQQQAPRVEAKKPRSGGAFANTADEPQRPQQRSAAQPAQPALRRRLDLREDIAAARDIEPQPTPAEDAHEQDAATHVRRYAKPKILEVPGHDGLYRAIFGGHATTEPVVICVCERCGYGRPATDLETPFSNGIGEPHYNMTFGEGMWSQGAPIPLKQPTFICKRCPRYGSRPYGVGGARRIAPPAPEIAITTPAAPTAYEATPIVENPQNIASRKLWEECVANSKNPEYQSALNESKETAAREQQERRQQISVLQGQGTAWKVLDLAKLEPPRREGLRALNVAALLADFRSLGKSKGLPFCIRFALEAALLKNEPMKNEVTCYNVVSTFSTKVVPKVADHWKSRRRGQLESWWTAVALGDPLALLVGRLAEERRDGLSPDLALRAFSKAAIEAMDDALRHRRQTVGSLEAEHALLHSTDASAKARVQVPNLRARLSHNLQTDTVELIPTSIEFRGHSRATHFELAAADHFVGSRIKFDAGEIVEHFTKRGGELAPIRCCGEDCYYLFDKGISPTIHFLRTRPEDGELDRFYSAENFLQSLGDFTGVKDSKLGHRVSLAFTATIPTVTLALHQISVIPDVWRAGYCWSDGCGVISQGLADLVSRAMGTRVTACQIRIGLCKGHSCLEVKAAAKIKKAGNMLFCQAIIVISNMLMDERDRAGGDARFLHELMNKFIEDTLLWTKADGSPGILDEGATPEHLAKLEAALRQIEILPETFVGDEDDDDRARLLERRWRSPFSNDGSPENMKVLKAISRALVAAKAKMNIPCGVNADGESDLWIAQGVCAADVNIELSEGEVLIGNGAFVGDVLCLRSPCCNKGDVRKLMAVAGRPEWRHLRDVAVFSYQGERPEPDKMAGGDLDGDEYYFALPRGAFYQIVLLAKEAAPAAYAARDPRSDDELRAWAAADAALKATTVFSPSTRAIFPSATAMISSLRLCEIKTSDAPRHRRDGDSSLVDFHTGLRILLDRGKLVPRSAINWLLAVDRNGVASEAAERWARCHELALDVRTTGRGDALQNAFDAAMRCSRSSSQQQPRWIPSGAAAPRGKLVDGTHPIMPGMFYRYGSIIDAVEKRMKQLLYDVDDPLARRAEAKLVGSVLDLSRAEEPEMAARLTRELRVSSYNDAKDAAKMFAELYKDPRFADARRELQLTREVRKRLHSVLDADELYAPVRHVSRGTEPKKLVLTFKKQRREDFPDLLRLLPDDGAGDADASLRENFREAVRFAERASVGEEKKFVFETQHRRRVHDFFDCPEYWHVSHQTVKDKILFKIKWSRDPMLAVARDHPDGIAKELLDGEEAVRSVGHATSAADRAPAPKIDARRAVDDAAAPARPPRPPRREPEPLSEMEALRRAQEASLAEARARAAADKFEQDVVANSLKDEQRRADRARTFREVNDNSELMALAASREAYEAYERDELKRQERELRRFERERERRLSGYVSDEVKDEVKDESKLERRARDESQGVAESKEEPPAETEDLDAAVVASLEAEEADAARLRETEDAELVRALAESERPAASLAADAAVAPADLEGLEASRAESRADDGDKQLLAALELSAREASAPAPAVADGPGEDIDAVLAASLAAEDADAARRREAEDAELARALAESCEAPVPSDEAGGLAAELRDVEEQERQLAECQRQAAERARQLRERIADKENIASQANEISRLRDENQNLRNLQQIVADGLGRVTPDAAAPTGDVAPEGYAIVAVLLANEGLSGLLELFIENEIDDDALAHVSVEDLVEVNVPAGAARRILSK